MKTNANFSFSSLLLEIGPVVDDWQSKGPFVEAGPCLPYDKVLRVFSRDWSFTVRYKIPAQVAS